MDEKHKEMMKEHHGMMKAHCCGHDEETIKKHQEIMKEKGLDEEMLKKHYEMMGGHGCQDFIKKIDNMDKKLDKILEKLNS